MPRKTPDGGYMKGSRFKLTPMGSEVRIAYAKRGRKFDPFDFIIVPKNKVGDTIGRITKGVWV